MTQQMKNNLEHWATWVWKGVVMGLCAFILMVANEIREDVNILMRERSAIIERIGNAERKNTSQDTDIKDITKDINTLYREQLKQVR